MIGLYFAFGIGFYVGLALKEPEGFVEANAAALLRGLLLAVVFWPIGLVVQTIFAIERLEHERRKPTDTRRNK